jgi:hypothetical protein
MSAEDTGAEASESNVTFVGGKAVEQHEAPDVEDAHADEREAAKAAVKKAIEKAADDSAKSSKRAAKQDPFKPPGAKKEGEKADEGEGEGEDEDEDEAEDKPAPKPKAKPKDDDDDLDPETIGLKQALKAREKLAKARQKQNDEHQRAQYELQRQYHALQERERQLQSEAARIQALKTDPARAIKEAGWDPEDFILSLAQEGTPEGKVARLVREQQAKLAEVEQWRQEQYRAQQEAYQRAQLQEASHRRMSVEQEFRQLAFNEDKYPHMTSFYQGREQALIAEGDLIAAQFRHATGGREASLQDIADYIEEQLAERANSWYEKRSKKNKTQQDGSYELPGKPARGGSRGKTLSSSGSSERRALPSRLEDLDGDERLQAAREAVGLALAKVKHASADD